MNVYGLMAFAGLVVVMVGMTLLIADHYLEIKRDEIVYKHIKKASRQIMKRTEEMMFNITDRTMEKAIEKTAEMTKKMYSEE